MKFLKIILLAIIICFAGYSAKSQVKYKLTVPSDQQIEKREMKNREIYNHIKSPDLQRITKPGAPNLPVNYINLLVPPGTENYKITVETGKEKTIQRQKHIAPVQPPIPTAINYEQPEFVRPDSAIYSSNQPYPEKRVEVVEVNHMRGNKILTLAVHPYIYYPKYKQLNMYGIQDVLVKYENRPVKKISNYRRGNPAKKDLILLKSMIDNKKDVARFNVWKTIDEQKIAPDNTEQNSKSVDMGYEYVIITSQNLSSAFDEFIEWKKRKGIDIGLVTVEDILDHYTGDMISGIYDNAGKVRQYLKDAYGYGLEYALLGGDYTVVPIRYGTGDDDTWTYIPENPNDYKIPADLYFSDFDGDWNVD